MKNAIIAVIGALVLFGVGLGIGWSMHSKEYAKVPETLPTEEETRLYAPIEPPTEVFQETAPAETKYTTEEIESVFGADIQEYCIRAFGEYQEALQSLCAILKDSGYNYFVPFNSDEETLILDGDYVEFNIYLPSARGRATIKKSDTYHTEFYILEDGEMETEMIPEEEEEY